MNGKLIVIEGLDGCGKNTQTRLLADYLEANNIKTKYVSFPNYSEPSSSLVKMYLGGEFGTNPNDVNAYAASSFFAVDRYASFKKHWQKNYQNGNVIVCDRYTTSNPAYHMHKLPQTLWDEYLTWLYDYEYNKLGLPEPDAVIYLDVPVEASQHLMEKRYCGNESKKDLHEANVKFLKNCAEVAKYVCKKSGWTVINCASGGVIKSKEAIQNEIFSSLKGDVLSEFEI